MVRPIDVSQVINSLQYLGQSRQRLADIERENKRRRSSTGAQLGGIAGGIIGGIYGGPVGGAAGGAIGSYAGGRLAGGNADSGQVAQSGYQGYQMGQQQQQQEQQQQQVERNKAQSLKMKEHYSREDATPQQKEFAATIPETGSQESPMDLMKNFAAMRSLKETKPFTSEQYKEKFGRDAPIGYDMQQKPDGTIIYQKVDTAQPNQAIVSMGIDAAKRLKNEYSDLFKEGYVSSDVKKVREDELSQTGGADLSQEGYVSAEKSAEREKEFLGKINALKQKTSQLSTAPGVAYAQAEKEINRLVPIPKETESVSYVEEGGKWNKVTSKGGETIKTEEVSAEDVPNDEPPVPLTIAAKSAIGIITNSLDGDPTPAQQKDINLINQLSKSKAKDQTPAIKQIENIQKRYDTTGDNVTKDFWAVNEEGKSISLGYTTFKDAKEIAPEGFTVTAAQPKGDLLVKDYFAVNKDGDSKFLGNISRKEAVEKVPEGFTLTSTMPKEKKDAGTQAERNFNFMGDVVTRIKNGEPVSDDELMRYSTVWTNTAKATTVSDAMGNKSVVYESGYPTIDYIRNSQKQPDTGGQQPELAQQNAGEQSVGATPVPYSTTPQPIVTQRQLSPVSSAQAGTPVATPYSKTVNVGEKAWQKASNNDYETIKSLGQYVNALNVMETHSDDMSWANKLAPLGDTGDTLSKFVAKKLPQGALDAVGIKPGAKKWVAAYTNQVLAMQQMVKGNPSDRDIAFMLESTASPTNDPGYNKQVIQYNKDQIKSALKLKFEMMITEKKKITPEMEAVATRAGINVADLYKSIDKSPRDVYDSNMNEIRRSHATFASIAGENYKPKSSMSFQEKGKEKTYLGRPAEYLVSTDNRLFEGVKYTPIMASQIVKNKDVYNKLSREDKLILLESFKNG